MGGNDLPPMILLMDERKMKRKGNIKSKITPYLFLLPGLILFVVFLIYPILKSFQMSFYDWNIMPGAENEFVGLANYERAFNDEVVKTALKNSLLYAVITVPGQMIFALFFAILLNNIKRCKTLFRTLFYIPVVTSWVVVSLLFLYLFQSPRGIVNYLLVDVLHIFKEAVPWLQQSSTAFIPVLILGIWKGIGWSLVVYLAALQSIPTDLYESAAIDGANSWQKLIRITIPLIRPTNAYLLVMLTIGGLNVFTSVLMITNGGPLQSTEVMLTYMYHQAFDYLDFGYGSTLSFILAFIVIILSVLQLKFIRKPSEIS